MVKHFIEPEFCLIPDWITARATLYLRTNKFLDPVPYLHLYKGGHTRTLNWIAQDGGKQYVLPAFGTHHDPEFFFEEEDRIALHKGNFFQCRGEFFFIAEGKGRGLYFKQLVIANTTSLIQLVAESFGCRDFDFIICKAYEISREHSFIGYVWSGCKNNPFARNRLLIILPVFIEDLFKIFQYSPEDLHLIPLEIGEVMKHKDQRFIVKSDEEGIYIDDFANALCNKRRL